MKRAQLTVFIILGLLIVSTVGLVIFLNAQRSRTFAGLPQTEEVALAVQPVQDYVIACVTRLGREGLKRIGDHGGYLSTREIPRAKFNPVEVTESDALFLSPDSDYGIAYWWYMNSKNTCAGGCTFASKRPNLYKRDGEPSIEGQLERYVEQNLPNCIRNFEPFASQGITVATESQPDVEAYVTRDDVVIGLHQDFKATHAGNTYRLRVFAANLPVRMKDIFDLATNITVLESENAFLAKHARELITVFSRTDSRALPPVNTVEFELGAGETWVKFQVLQQVTQLLMNYVPLLQVFGTRNYRPIEAPLRADNRDTVDAALNRNALIPQFKAFPQLEARFAYIDAWKPYFDLNCEGQVCKSESFLNTFVLIFGIQRYQFAYDVSYPVMVELREPGALNGEGYTFRFALEGNLRNNEPVTKTWVPIAVSLEDTSTLLCRDSQRTSGFVTIDLIDSVTGNPVEGAVKYACGPESCIIGQARNGRLTTRLPRCLGGQLIASQQDYIADAVNVNTNTDDNQTVAIEMHPMKRLNVTVQKLQLKKDLATDSWTLDTTPVLSGPYDQFTISLARQPSGDSEPFNAFAAVCGTPFTASTGLPREIQLAPGTYDVTISSIYHGDIVIPPDKRCFDRGPFRSDKCIYVPDAPIYFGNSTGKPCTSQKPFPSGTIAFQWTVSPEMLRNAKRVVFKTIVMAAELPGTRLIVEDLEQITKTQDYVEAERDLIRPLVT